MIAILIVLLWISAEPTTIVLHEEASWYQERSEPEEEWEGVLEVLDTVQGPGGRTHRYALARENAARLPIYTGNLGDVLDDLEHRRVRVTGKLVDLTDEGFGEEIWPSRVECVDYTQNKRKFENRPLCPAPRSHFGDLNSEFLREATQNRARVPLSYTPIAHAERFWPLGRRL